MVHKKIFLHSFQASEMVLTTKWGGISPEIQICAALFVGWKEISVVLLRMNMRYYTYNVGDSVSFLKTATYLK